MAQSDLLIDVADVSKKYCRSLKRSLLYSVRDIAGELTGQTTSGKLRRDEFWAIRDVSFQLRRGECLGLIGPNGAGKSTLLKLLNGIVKPDRGRIEVRGRVGALIELGAGFNPILTGRENIYNRGAFFGFSRDEIASRFDAIVDFAEIGDFLDTPLRNYSSGMKVRLGFAVSAQMDPDVLLIDEVLAVGDIGFRLKCLNAISRLLDRTASIFVSHSMPQIVKVATKAMHINHGRVQCVSDDVGAVIDDYFAEFGSEPHRESGSGKAALASISISSGDATSESRAQPLLVDHGAPLQIDLGISLADGVPRAKIRLVFSTQEMRPVAEIHSALSDFYVENRTEQNRVRVVLERVPFNSGLHSISVIIVEPRQSRDEAYLRVDNAAAFQVRTFARCWADSILPGSWTQLPPAPGRRVVGHASGEGTKP